MDEIDYDEDQDLLRRYNQTLLLKKTVQELQGIAAAVIYDGKIDDNEIDQLKKWIDAHRLETKQWPLCEVRDVLNQILDDGEVTPEERNRLFDSLSRFAAGPHLPKVVEGIFDPGPTISFMEKEFVFTGILQFGSRRKAENTVLDRGGIVGKSVTRSLHYLIVGDLGNQTWKYSRFGDKIEKALGRRRNGFAFPLIVRERDFVKAVLREEETRE
ncbi:BRCT domain-containing protein [Candidatus Manganitrophus noduliformans]|uniref:BRCT domain-containing protein n=1 Tax=Candidatus Manganitrophus noduliformans TaxID=2606439 RepID=A0A7X6IBA5_9BACT|nr:BRCT domain-containing protein [Candidatus Manganitrophus noduliformans]NKE71245.1 hypothetical protein [Candidatus Manganitrophus noduliformans]